MNKDQGIGAVILVANVAGIVLCAWLIYAFTILVLQITAFVAVAGMLGIAAWIGWTMATAPPPSSLELEPVSPEPSASAEKQAWSFRSLGEPGARHVQPELRPGYSPLAAYSPTELECVHVSLPGPESSSGIL